MSMIRPTNGGFWRWLTDQRAAHGGWSLSRTGLQAGLSGRTLDQARARGTTPSPRTCWRLAALFGVDADHVLALAGHRRPAPANDLRAALRAGYPGAAAEDLDRALAAVQRILGGTAP